MGEKGNGLDSGMAAGALGDPSVIERVTTTTTQTVVGASEDLVTKVKDTALDHGADAVIDEARGRLERRRDTEEDSPDGSTGHDPTGGRDDAGSAR